MTSNGNGNGMDEAEVEDFTDESSIFDEIIQKIKQFESSKFKIIEQETALRQIIRAKNDQERDAIQHCKDLLQHKEDLRTELIRLNDKNERMSDQMDTVKALETEIQSLNSICSDMKTSTCNYADLLQERQTRILSLKPLISGHDASTSTDIEAPNDHDKLLTELNQTILDKLQIVSDQIDTVCALHDIRPMKEMVALLNEEKALRKQVRDLKRQLKKDTTDSAGPRGTKRSAPSSQRSRKRQSGPRVSLI